MNQHVFFLQLQIRTVFSHGCLQTGQMSALHPIDIRQQEIVTGVDNHISYLLSRQSLPYDGRIKACIREHLFDLLRDYPQLGVKVDNNLKHLCHDLSPRVLPS